MVGVDAAGNDETAEHLPEVHLAMTNDARRIHQDVLIDVVTSLPTGLVVSYSADSDGVVKPVIHLKVISILLLLCIDLQTLITDHFLT